MSDKPKGTLYEMCVRGDDYREEYEFEMFGEEITALMKPIKDKKFLPLTAYLKEHLDIDEEEAVEKVEEAKEESDGETIDISKMDEDFVTSIQNAAVYGIAGSVEDDGEIIEYTEDEARKMVDKMIGGYSVELGGKALEISGNVRDVKKFPGSRGGQ
ncbi:hypothetical protein [Halocatena marina]|uniref:hypothetical protein n=1 Tax=Halocatena marina TaxID=2934937 RepID=UPI002230DE02|nr:hypothetical protein [Halocatena marina]